MTNATPRVLLVEDHDDTRAMLAFVLEDSGYSVTSRATVIDATKSIRNQRFDLVVVDSRLPDGSGIQLCHQIREIDRYTPIVFCSTEGHDKQARQAIAAGAQAYLMKPFEIDHFRDTVSKLIHAEIKQKMHSAAGKASCSRK